MAYTAGVVTTGQIWEGSHFVVITGDSAQELYNFIKWGDSERIPDILPDSVVQNKAMKCTFNEQRSSKYECVFSMTKEGKIIPGM